MSVFKTTTLSLLTLMATAFVSPAAQAQVPGIQKKTICTATINSTEEKESFQKYLSADYFNFVELVKNKTDIDFLSRSCRSQKIKCDVVLVSGHFGGGFTDNKTFFLPVEDMEKTSCGGCPNVLGDASVVYLFGCNTLAGKDLDGRTPEEYFQVLTDEVGLEPAEARATVAVRYSALGDSFNDRLRRIFKGSAVIAGFNSKAPLGSQIQPSINAYFGNLVPGLKHDGILEEWERTKISVKYYQMLDQLKADQANGNNRRIYESGKRIFPDLRNMVGGGFTDVPGIMAGSNEEFVANKLCSMKDSAKERLKGIEDIINTGDRLSVIQMLPYLLDMSKRGQHMNGEQKAFFARLGQNPTIRDIIVGEKGIVSELNGAPEEQTNTVDLAVNLGWYGADVQARYYRAAAVYVWNNTGGFIENKKLLQKLDGDLKSVQSNEIQPAAFKGVAMWKMIQTRKADQADWIELAKVNLPVTIAYYEKSFANHKTEAADTKHSKDTIKMHKDKMKENRGDLDDVCSIASKFRAISAADLQTMLLPHQSALEDIGAGKCLRLIR